MQPNYLTFGEALGELRDGKFVGRANWNAHHKLCIQWPYTHSENTRAYIYMIIGGDAMDMKGERVPWVASQTDLLAEDWVVIEE